MGRSPRSYRDLERLQAFENVCGVVKVQGLSEARLYKTLWGSVMRNWSIRDEEMEEVSGEL